MQTNFYSYGNERFIDIFPDYDTFQSKINDSFIKGLISDDKFKILYNLLLGRYGVAEINSKSGSAYWLCRFYNIIYEYAPEYFKKREIQDNLREMSVDDIMQGTKAIYNTAQNPDSKPSTNSLEELTYISNQSTTNYKYSKLEGYARLMELMKTDSTSSFLNKFQKLFMQVLTPYQPLLYNYESED